MLNRKGLPRSALFQCYLIVLISISCIVHAECRRVVKKEERCPVVSTEYGEISAVRVSDGINASYLLHFFTLEPNSVLLPVVLSADMLFYVRAGSGKLSWTEEDELRHIDLRRGDVYRLLQGSVFYITSETEQGRLKIDAIFPNSIDDLSEPATGPYSSIQDMILGFDNRILEATFGVSEEVIDEVSGGTKPPAITRLDEICGGFGESCDLVEMNKKKKEKEKKKKEKAKGKEQSRLFNVLKEDKEIENCNGWSTTVTNKQLSALEGSNIGLFMVNLRAGSMMGPHWNAMDSEVVIVLQGRGVVTVSCSSVSNETDCRSWRFEVEEGDVFAVPKFHPTAQMAFNNGSFVFVGFSRMTERRKAQFLAGESSVLQILDKQVLQRALNIKRETLEELLAPRDDSVVISACISCAEEEIQIMEEEGGRRRREKRRREYGGGEEAWRRREYGGGGGEGEERWRRGIVMKRRLTGF